MKVLNLPEQIGMVKEGKNMLQNWVNEKVSDFIEKNIEAILANVSDETICKLFDMSKNFVIEARQLKREVILLKLENEKLRKENEKINFSR